jgi:hypothetical protein
MKGKHKTSRKVKKKGGADIRRGRKGGTTERPNCNDCRITSITVTRDANPPETAAFPANRNSVEFPVLENVNTLTVSVTTSKPHCPCIWSNIALSYVWNLAGPENIKRRHLQMPQLIDSSNNNLDPNGAYVTRAACTLTIKISDLNRDMRNGSITPPFRKGVPLEISTMVKCDPRPTGKAKTIRIRLEDAD